MLAMIWTKRRSRFENLLAGCLRGRLRLHSTGYRAAYEERGKIWMELDQKLVISFCDFRHENTLKAHRNHFSEHRARQELQEKSIFSKTEFSQALEAYIDLSMEGVLAHESALVRGIGMLDRRLGKRRLLLLQEQNPKGFPGQMLQLRLEAEGLIPPAT